MPNESAPMREKDEHYGLNGGEKSDKGGDRRKRSAPFVTKNACVACRKRRARCDGNQPCSRCITHNEPKCHYDVSTRITKEAMREEILILKAYKDASDRVLGALAREEAGNGESPVSSRILGAIRSGKDMDEISRFLDEEEEEDEMNVRREWKKEERDDGQESMSTLQSPATAANPTTSCISSAAHTPYSRPRGFSAEPNLSPTTAASPSSSTATRRLLSARFNVTQWTTVTSDLSLIENLMAFYFCWEYPIFASISKTEFLEDYFAGRTRFCSSLLVNAILSVGHRYLAASTNSSSPEDLLTHKDYGPEIGAKFQAEAELLLKEENGKPSLATVQALGMLSIREASCGRNSQSWGYSCASIRMAVEMGLHRPSPEATREEEVDVRVATFWGAFALDQFWSLNIGRMPHISRSSIIVEKPHIVPSEEHEKWGPYNNVMSPLKEAQQPSNVRSVCQAFAGLTEIIHDSQHLLYEPRDGNLNGKMLGVYRRYLEWYGDLPPVLRLGINSTPSVLFAHIYYHFSLILFFRPFLKVRFHNSHIVPRDICLEAASAISLLVKSYRNMHTLRRTPCLFPYMIFAASVIHLICVADTPTIKSDTKGTGAEADMVAHIAEKMDVDAEKGGVETHSNEKSPTDATPLPSAVPRLVVSEQVIQDIRDLNEMAACHTFARRARQILVRMAMNWKIEPPADLLYPSSLSSPTSSTSTASPDANNGGAKRRNSYGANIINWKKVMDTEGVFSSTPDDEVREGLPRSTSFNFFCPDLDEELPGQWDDSHGLMREIKLLEVEGKGREADVEMEGGLRGGGLRGGGLRGGGDEDWEARDGKPFFSPFLAQKLPLVSMKRERGGRKFTF